MNDNETRLIHEVLGWTGGEAQSEPWTEAGAMIAEGEMWMEDAPDYAEIKDRHAHGAYYRTVIAYMRDEITAPGWEQVARYSTSGERDCGWCGAGTEYYAEHGKHDDECEDCEGDGTIYIGDGYAEHVMRATGAVEEPAPLGPGKYDDRLARAVDLLSLDGGNDDETGEVDGPGHYILMRDGKRLDAARVERWHHADDESEADGYLVSNEEREELRASAGAIIYTNSDGFVYVTLYATTDELNEAWQEIEEDVAEFYAEEDGTEDAAD